LTSSEQSDVQTIAVLPDNRGEGFGRALMNQLLQTAAHQGAKQVFLEVRADNQPLRNYTSRSDSRSSTSVAATTSQMEWMLW
jgi:GNAT superfamily N-acetyltransferase